ncbi:MAG: hypothetical protein FWG10_06755 [Eubacteriaceae bacterium]|nr:hypothetical protein [Eubacteriaceae bacterium]
MPTRFRKKLAIIFLLMFAAGTSSCADKSNPTNSSAGFLSIYTDPRSSEFMQLSNVEQLGSENEAPIRFSTSEQGVWATLRLPQRASPSNFAMGCP